MDNKRAGNSKHFDFILLDVICVELAFFLAYYIRLGIEGVSVSMNYFEINGLILLVHFAVIFMSENYSGVLRRGYLKELKYVLTYNIELLAVVLAFLFFSKQSAEYSRIIIALFFGFNNLFVYLVRCLRKHHLCKRNSNDAKKERMLLVTDYARAKELVDGLQTYNYSSSSIHGIAIIDRDIKGEKIGDSEVVANATDMYDYVRTNIIDEIFVSVKNADTNEIVNKFLIMGVTVHVDINGIISNVPNPSIKKINSYTVLTTGINIMSTKQRIIKRLFDIFVSLFGAIFAFLLMIIVGPIIKIQSPGPIFFKQTRVGRNGRLFKMYKFRSMYMDAEERKKELMKDNKMNGLMFKMDNDPRITPIGRFIRKTSIDEFPQFFNILKGDMSLVGTRPPTVDEYEQYDFHHKSRLAMKPGLTGMWQVSGRSEITDFEEIVRLDNEYIRNFSLSNDLKIMVKTVAVVFARKGSV